MNDEKVREIHWSFWAIGVVSLIWNVLSSVNFFAQMNPDALAAYRETERAIVEGRPIWATGAFAVAVFGGTIGSILLLVRKSNAFYVFIVSLIGVIVTMIHALGLGIDFGFGEILGIILMPMGVAIFLIWYTINTKSRGWLN